MIKFDTPTESKFTLAQFGLTFRPLCGFILNHERLYAFTQNARSRFRLNSCWFLYFILQISKGKCLTPFLHTLEMTNVKIGLMLLSLVFINYQFQFIKKEGGAKIVRPYLLGTILFFYFDSYF